MGSQNWEVRQGRKISADGSWATAYVAHILDERGESTRNRWFRTREEAERWAQDNVSIGKALETASSAATAAAAPVGDARLRQIIELGGLCNAGEVLAMAAELLTLRAEGAAQAAATPAAQPFRVGWS